MAVTHLRNDDVFIGVELVTCAHIEKCPDVEPVVALCAEEGVSRCFRPQPLTAARFEPHSHNKRHRWSAGVPFPARLEVRFLVVMVCAAGISSCH